MLAVEIMNSDNIYLNPILDMVNESKLFNDKYNNMDENKHNEGVEKNLC